jgi:nitrite reductase (NADH) large subunit
MLDPIARIVIITHELQLPYNKCLLADVLVGNKKCNEIILLTAVMLAEKRIELITGCTAVALDPCNNTVLCADGTQYAYDALCIATGCSPRLLPFLSAHPAINLFTFYYQRDLTALIDYVTTHHPRHAVVIGAGLTGLEVADGLLARGIAVTVIEAAQQVLPHQISAHAATLIQEAMRTAGISLQLNKMVTAVAGKEERIIGVQYTGGYLATDMLVCAIGAMPNTQWVQDAGISCTKNGLIIVDEIFQTSIPTIYAVGDCIQIYDRLFEIQQPSTTWSDAMQQGMHAAYAMSGRSKQYSGTTKIITTEVFGLSIAYAGPVELSVGMHVKEVTGPGWYHRFIYKNGQLRGFTLIGNTHELAQYRRMLSS